MLLPIKLIRAFALYAACAILGTGCHTLDDDRIPVTPVNLAFASEALWNIYGTAGAMDYNSFIRDSRIPRNFPYTATSYTGFGGILLVGTVLGEPAAYDLACPVERDRDVIVAIDTETMLARCPVCKSTYDVFSLDGYPTSGPAAEKGYGLRRYRVARGRIDYMLVSF